MPSQQFFNADYSIRIQTLCFVIKAWSLTVLLEIKNDPGVEWMVCLWSSEGSWNSWVNVCALVIFSKHAKKTSKDICTLKAKFVYNQCHHEVLFLLTLIPHSYFSIGCALKCDLSTFLIQDIVKAQRLSAHINKPGEPCQPESFCIGTICIACVPATYS